MISTRDDAIEALKKAVEKHAYTPSGYCTECGRGGRKYVHTDWCWVGQAERLLAGEEVEKRAKEIYVHHFAPNYTRNRPWESIRDNTKAKYRAAARRELEAERGQAT